MVSLLWIQQAFAKDTDVFKKLVNKLNMTRPLDVLEHINDQWQCRKSEESYYRQWGESLSERLLRSFSLWQTIFTHVLGMRQEAAKCVQKLLVFAQKQHQIELAQELLNEVNDDLELLKRVTTGSRTWGSVFFKEIVSHEFLLPEVTRSIRSTT